MALYSSAIVMKGFNCGRKSFLAKIVTACEAEVSGADPGFLREGASQADMTDVKARSLLNNYIICMHLLTG